MHKVILLFLVVFSLFSCGENKQPTEPKSPEITECGQVDSLVGDIEEFQKALATNSPTSKRENHLRKIIALMDLNAGVEGECNYLNTDLYPDHLRFDFVEGLRDWAIRDTFSNGVYYLLELRGAYSDDSAIYEFFSEEIARVALDNPTCYDQYLRGHRGQINMVLSTTQWNYPDLPQIKSQFKDINSLPEIIDFLDKLKPSLP